jgi:beta-glucanase (GH16 family)
MECDTNAAFTLTIHKWGVDGKTDSILGTARFQLKKDLTDNYHVWAADWQPGYIDFYLDGIKIYHYTGEIPNCPMYVWVSNSYKTVIPTTSLVKQIRVQV